MKMSSQKIATKHQTQKDRSQKATTQSFCRRIVFSTDVRRKKDIVLKNIKYLIILSCCSYGVMMQIPHAHTSPYGYFLIQSMYRTRF